ncbi:hypothetical protein JCM6882_008157 [Rhodosporidiobolus microsporus]
MKRLLLFCDGTAMDADNEEDPDLYTNVAKLSRAMMEEDKRGGKTVEQIKFYQSGVGTDEEALGDLVSSALGRGMLQKVKDLYDFLCLNWEEGDEIFLFGFSRGGYTVRLLASLINIIGILSPPQNMHLFPSLVAALDRNKGDDHGPHEDDAMLEIRKVLKPLSGFRARQQKALNGGFLIKCVAVFDTVATRGRPSAFRPSSFSSPSHPKYNSFGVDQTYLEPCVEVALQALAVDERRVDYRPVIWERDEGGEAERRGQVLRQVWFSGAHCDIGGGYKEQDLSSISLTWMVAQLQDHLAFNFDYLERVTGKTTAPYGQMAPHQSRVGTFRLAAAEDRVLPLRPNPRTNEFYHPSITLQPPSHIRNAALRSILASPAASAGLFVKLDPLEEALRRKWPAPNSGLEAPGTPRDSDEEEDAKKAAEGVHTDSGSEAGSASPPPSPAHTASTSSSLYHYSLAPPTGRPSSVTSFTDNESRPASPDGGVSVFSSAPASSSAGESVPPSPTGSAHQLESRRSRSPVAMARREWRKLKKEVGERRKRAAR